MARIVISLLGGRPLPNVLSVLHLRPDRIYVVASQDSLGEGGSYEKMVNALPKHLRPSRPYSVKPYNLQDTIRQCTVITNQHPEDEIIVVSASEPKIMSFGAYDVVKGLREQRENVEMCYVARDGLMWIFQSASDIESVRIGLQDYFSSYGWNVTSKPEPDERFKNLVKLLVQNLPIAHRLLHVLRSNDRGKGKRTISCRKSLNDQEFFLLLEIEQLQIVSNVQRTDSEAKWTINGDKEARFLLTGDWLEFVVYQLASQSGLFDECGWGVEDLSDKGEIDFAGIFGGQMVIASCKTEDRIKRAWFEELHSKVEQLGKGMCSAMLISSVSRNGGDPGTLKKYEKWAQERQIVLVMAEDLPQLPAILRKIVEGDQNVEPKHIPCYPRI